MVYVCVYVCLHLWSYTKLTRSSATTESTARPSCLVGLFDKIFQEKICWY